MDMKRKNDWFQYYTIAMYSTTSQLGASENPPGQPRESRAYLLPLATPSKNPSKNALLLGEETC